MTKRTPALIFLAVLAGYAAYKGMQVLAICSSAAFLALLYYIRSLQLFDTFIRLLENTREAKYKDIELTIGNRLRDAAKHFPDAPPWIHFMSATLSDEEIGLLMSASNSSDFVMHSTHKHTFRLLRSKGLVIHDKETMEESSRISLTAKGQELADYFDGSQRV